MQQYAPNNGMAHCMGLRDICLLQRRLYVTESLPQTAKLRIMQSGSSFKHKLKY